MTSDTGAPARRMIFLAAVENLFNVWAKDGIGRFQRLSNKGQAAKSLEFLDLLSYS